MSPRRGSGVEQRRADKPLIAPRTTGSVASASHGPRCGCVPVGGNPVDMAHVIGQTATGGLATWRPLLEELLWTYGPCGQEDAVRDICQRELEPEVDESWVDAAGNLVALIRGDSDSDGERVTRVMAHMDELSMLVKRVEPDGTLHLAPLGTMYPGTFGLGPVAILGRHETLIGVLTLGSEHTTKESQRIWETKPDHGDKSLDWMHVYVFTGRTPVGRSGGGSRHTRLRGSQQAVGGGGR